MQHTIGQSSRRTMRLFGSGIVALMLGACGSDTPTGVDDELETVRRLTAPFQSLDAARAAGYTVWSPDPMAANATCASNADGKMGYHLVNAALRGSPADPANGDAIVDAERPEMLLFEKRGDGTLHLVGVEYLVFTAAWEKAHPGGSPPTVFGQQLLASRHTFVAGGPEIDHYELHIWLHKSNPNGMFSAWSGRPSRCRRTHRSAARPTAC